MKKAFSYQRIGAYFIDIIVLSLILSLLTFWIPKSEKYRHFSVYSVLNLHNPVKMPADSSHPHS